MKVPKLYAKLAKVADRSRFEEALNEALICRPPKPKRKTNRKSPGGLHRTTLYLSPKEVAALKQIHDEFDISTTLIIRTLIRLFWTVPVDKPDDAKE